MLGLGLISYADPTQTANAAQGFVDMLVQNPGNQSAVVAQLQQLDAPTRAAVCAQMAADCWNQDDPTGCGTLVGNACAAAQAGGAAPGTSTTGVISTTGAVVIGVAVVGLLFWAIR